MRILLSIHHTLDRNSGAPGVTLAQADALRGHGCVVRVFSHDDLPRGLRGRLGFLVYPLVLAWHILVAAGRGRYDWVDASTGDAWVLALAPKWWRPQLAMTSHGIEHEVHEQLVRDVKAGRAKVSWKYWLYRGSIHLWLIAFTARRSDAVWALNRSEQRYLVDRLGVRPERCHLIANGLDPDLEGVVPADSLRRLDGPPDLAFIGSYIERKGVRDLELFAATYLRRHTSATLRLLGTGGNAQEIQASFPEDVRERVRVTPRFERRDLPSLLTGCGVIVLPSHVEGFGVAILDAMACGLAPVVTEACGIADHLTPGAEILTAPTGEPEAFAARLFELAENPDRLLAIRKAALAAVSAFSWRTIMRSKLAIYASSAEEPLLAGAAIPCDEGGLAP